MKRYICESCSKEVVTNVINNENQTRGIINGKGTFLLLPGRNNPLTGSVDVNLAMSAVEGMPDICWTCFFKILSEVTQ